MTASAQTVAALLIVALASAALIRHAIVSRKTGCGDGCGAVSPDAKALLKKLRNR